MKCPECGFVSFPGLNRCKKCGRRLAPASGEGSGVASFFHQLLTEPRGADEPVSGASHDIAETGGELDIELNPKGASSHSVQPEAGRTDPRPLQSDEHQDWQNELAERVEEYRHRRSRLRKDEADRRKPLNLDFGPPPPGPQQGQPNIIEFPSSEELHRQAQPQTAARPPERKTGLENFEAAFQTEGGIESRPDKKIGSPSKMDPLQIEMGSSPGDSAAAIGGEPVSDAPGVSMGMRFFAGMLDALVLLSGAALYSLIFWRIGGQFSLQPLELGAIALITTIFVLLYFAGCTALASATPGLIWTRLEVCTFEGNPPTLSDCFWRAFGYLVSASALMLGFVWAVFDADSLTWHDRISRTFIAPVEDR